MANNASFVSSRKDDADYHLIGAYTLYSSWTARVETVLEYFQIPYKATYLNLYSEQGAAQLVALSPSRLVPVLQPAALGPSVLINDSLSIVEYLAESHPSLPLWPRDARLRALARSAVAEMHSGFSALRNAYPSNFIALYEGAVPLDDAMKREVQRLFVVWANARRATAERLGELGEKDEGFLFGGLGIADSFFWPILWRLRTYSVPLVGADPLAIEWMATMWNDPFLKALGDDYYRQAENSASYVKQYEDIYKGNPDVKFGRIQRDWKFAPPS